MTHNFYVQDSGPHHWNPYVKIFINRFFFVEKQESKCPEFETYFKTR